MLHVGLTGNIASGKSYAALLFAELGAHVIDADKVAHQLLNPGTTTFERVVETFGRGILTPDGTIDRKRLGSIVFADEARREALNLIVHPEVRREILRRIVDLEERSAGGMVIVDAALMVESGSYRLYDRIIVVKCDPALQMARLVERDGLTKSQALARIAAQMPVEEKVRRAHYVIDTSGTFRETREQVEAVYRELLLDEVRLREKRPG